MRRVVVFPAPLGPSSPNTSPRSTAKLISRQAIRPPKLFASPHASIAANAAEDYPSALPGVLPGPRGREVLVLEDKDAGGGAPRTEKPFAKAPGLATSTGAYLLGLMPPELIRKLGVDIPVLRRDPHYFLPTTGKRYLLFGSDQQAMRSQFVSFFSEQDWRANQALQTEIGQMRDDVAPTWLQEPLTIEETAEKFVRPPLRGAFVDLCRKPVGQYLDRFGFRSDLLKAMYAVTDGFSGVNGDWDTPGTGMNFLIHNMCRLPGADGTWMIVKGGMGTVTRTLAE